MNIKSENEIMSSDASAMSVQEYSSKSYRDEHIKQINTASICFEKFSSISLWRKYHNSQHSKNSNKLSTRNDGTKPKSSVKRSKISPKSLALIKKDTSKVKEGEAIKAI